MIQHIFSPNLEKYILFILSAGTNGKVDCTTMTFRIANLKFPYIYEGGTKRYALCCSRLINHTIQYFTILFLLHLMLHVHILKIICWKYHGIKPTTIMEFVAKSRPSPSLLFGAQRVLKLRTRF